MRKLLCDVCSDEIIPVESACEVIISPPENNRFGPGAPRTRFCHVHSGRCIELVREVFIPIEEEA